MEYLPEEIILEIFKHLADSGEKLHNYRLVCQKWNKCATEYIRKIESELILKYSSQISDFQHTIAKSDKDAFIFTKLCIHYEKSCLPLLLSLLQIHGEKLRSISLARSITSLQYNYEESKEMQAILTHLSNVRDLTITRYSPLKMDSLLFSPQWVFTNKLVLPKLQNIIFNEYSPRFILALETPLLRKITLNFSTQTVLFKEDIQELRKSLSDNCSGKVQCHLKFYSIIAYNNKDDFALFGSLLASLPSNVASLDLWLRFEDVGKNNLFMLMAPILQDILFKTSRILSSFGTFFIGSTTQLSEYVISLPLMPQLQHLELALELQYKRIPTKHETHKSCVIILNGVDHGRKSYVQVEELVINWNEFGMGLNLHNLFPNLSKVDVRECYPDNLIAICSHCTALKHLTLHPVDNESVNTWKEAITGYQNRSISNFQSFRNMQVLPRRNPCLVNLKQLTHFDVPILFDDIIIELSVLQMPNLRSITFLVDNVSIECLAELSRHNILVTRHKKF